MGGFIRFVAWFVLLVAGFVLVVLPLLLPPLLTQMVRDLGVKADTLEVNVALFDPSLLLGRSRQVTITAGNLDASPAHVDHFQLALGNASFFDRSFETVSGELRGVSVALGRDTVSASSISLSGPAEAAVAIAHLLPSEVERLITVSAARNGVPIDAVRVTSGGARVTVHGIEADARLLVHGGALLLDPGVGGPIVLLQPAPSDPWSLSDAWFSDAGLNISGAVDVRRMVGSLSR